VQKHEKIKKKVGLRSETFVQCHGPSGNPARAREREWEISLGANIVSFFGDKSDRWRPKNFHFTQSGESVIADVNALQPRFVVDVGCGYNLMKGRIPNLIGIDLVNSRADLICDMLEAPVAAETFDVALAMGSINFGGENLIKTQIAKVLSWLKPGGRLFMRVNPNALTSTIQYYPWTRQKITEFTDLFNLDLEAGIVDDRDTLAATPQDGLRYYFRWRKPY